MEIARPYSLSHFTGLADTDGFCSREQRKKVAKGIHVFLQLLEFADVFQHSHGAHPASAVLLSGGTLRFCQKDAELVAATALCRLLHCDFAA